MNQLGLISAVGAFLIWGMVPLFWKLLKTVPALELIMHRIVWSAFICLIVLLFNNQISSLLVIIKNKSLVKKLFLSTLLVSMNWFIFIWAVNNNHILETSLGYYILPILNVLMGSLVLKERLSKLQKWALLLSSLGVINLAISFGHFPWISLSLALSFGFYGLVRKKTQIDPIVGLTFEALLLTVPAIVYLVFLESQDLGNFGTDFIKNLLLFSCGIVTLVPLLLYLIGLKNLKLSTIGFLQFIVPTTTFFLAVYVYKEPFDNNKLITFVLIWVSVAMYLSDLKFRKN